MSDLATFAKAYLARIGAPLSVDLPDFLEAELPPAWRAWFDGRARLALALTRDALADHPHAEVLTHGARVLEQMAASLEEHGDFLAGELTGPAELVWPGIDGAIPAAGAPRVTTGTALAVWYRVTMVADEARESLVPVAVSADLPPGVVERFARALASGVPAGWEPRADTGAAAPLFARAREELAARLAEPMRAFRAEKEAAREEALARLRLHHDAERRELERLTSEGARQQLERLPETMLRRIEEERDTYAVRVKASPLAAALARLTAVEQTVRWERTDGVAFEVALAGCPALDPRVFVPCEACGEGIDEGVVCGRAAPHLSHTRCGQACGACGVNGCAGCLFGRCLVDNCAARLCAECKAGCASCRRAYCGAHAVRCGVCEQPGCPDHVAACGFCRGPTCLACRGGDVPATGRAGELDCAACRSPGRIAGARRVVPVRGWLGGRIEVWHAHTGDLITKRWVPPWRSWFDRRFVLS